MNRGDAEGLAALCAPDFRLDMSDRVFNPEVYSGHDGIRRFMAEVHERIYAYRALRFARNDPTELPGFDQDAYAPHSGANGTPLP